MGLGDYQLQGHCRINEVKGHSASPAQQWSPRAAKGEKYCKASGPQHDVIEWDSFAVLYPHYS